MQRRRFAALLSAVVSLVPLHAFAQSPVCIGQHTVRGLQFSGVGSMISEPFPIQEGAIFATSTMKGAGAITLMHADGSTILLRNAALPRSPGPAIQRLRREYRDRAPAADAARRDLATRVERIQARRARAEDLYLSGARDRIWFAGEDARAAAELTALDVELHALPEPPDEDAIAALWASLRDLRAIARDIALSERSGLLRALGTMVVSPSPARQHRDDGSTVALRPRPELRMLLTRQG